MSWRTVVVTDMAKLDYSLDYLVVRKKEVTSKIHISEIRVLIVESTLTSITTALLSELVKNKVKIILCDETHNPISEVMPYYGSYDTSAKVRQQVMWEQRLKLIVWTEIVREKIKKQRELLLEEGYTEEASLLTRYLKELSMGDETNREGHAAKVYFNALFGKDFSRDSDSSINASLNYGYGILLAHFTRAIVSNGYITQLGLFHDNMFNPYNLASDLMEPFRPIVDKRVLKMSPETFGTSEKQLILQVFNDNVCIDGKNQNVGNAIIMYCRSIFDAINQEDIALIKNYSNEL